MTEGEALYQSILDNPEDDAPRLIYSDWLEEQGNIQRAEFIRVQCQLARAEPYSPLFRKLFAKSRRLYKPIWSQTLRGKVLNAEMQRGFIHKVTIYSKRFITDFTEIFETEPIREVKFADFSAVRGNVPVATLALCPGLGRLTGLTLSGEAVTGRMVDILLDPGYLAGITKLCMDQTRIETGMYRQIFNSNRLPILKELSFNSPPNMDRNWLCNLADSNLLRQLEVFSLRNDPSSPEEINAFLSHKDLANVRRFELFSNFSDPLLSLIASNKNLYGLKDLDLSMANVGTRSLVDFASNPAFDQLRRLNLPMNRITNLAVQTLLQAEHLRKLYYLNLDANLINGKSRWKELLRAHCPEAIIRIN